MDKVTGKIRPIKREHDHDPSEELFKGGVFYDTKRKGVNQMLVPNQMRYVQRKELEDAERRRDSEEMDSFDTPEYKDFEEQYKKKWGNIVDIRVKSEEEMDLTQ